MNSLPWSKSRSFLLQLCILAIATASVYIIVKPEKDSFSDLTIDEWQSIDNGENKFKFEDKPVEGKKYEEASNNNLLVEVFFIPAMNLGGLDLIQQYFNFKSKPENIKITEDSSIGSYGLFTKDNSAYLSTCIHPEGKTAFTKQQFSELANYNIRSRIFPWILGLSDLRDWRCFWVNMSVNLDGIDEGKASKLLQKKLLSIVSETKFQ